MLWIGLTVKWAANAWKLVTSECKLLVMDLCNMKCVTLVDQVFSCCELSHCHELLQDRKQELFSDGGHNDSSHVVSERTFASLVHHILCVAHLWQSMLECVCVFSFSDQWSLQGIAEILVHTKLSSLNTEIFPISWNQLKLRKWNMH